MDDSYLNYNISKAFDLLAQVVYEYARRRGAQYPDELDHFQASVEVLCAEARLHLWRRFRLPGDPPE